MRNIVSSQDNHLAGARAAQAPPPPPGAQILGAQRVPVQIIVMHDIATTVIFAAPWHCPNVWYPFWVHISMHFSTVVYFLSPDFIIFRQFVSSPQK